MSQTRRIFQSAHWLRAMGAALALAFGASPVLAHKGSDAYLDVQQLAAPAVDSGAGKSNGSANAQTLADFNFALAVALRDLDLVVPIDANSDAQLTWGEIKAATPQVLAVLNETTGLTRAAPAETAASGSAPTASAAPAADGCALFWQANGLERRSDGVYFRATAQAHCPVGQQPLSFRYTLLKDQDATHRLLITGRIGGQDLLSTMSPQKGSTLLANSLKAASSASGSAEAMAPGDPAGRWSTLRDYFTLGMHHLLEGYDHLAFLLALVLPLQLSLRRPKPAAPRGGHRTTQKTARQAAGLTTGQTTPADGWRANWLALLRTVTAFTVGHSITLMLATFGLTQASPLWVEPAIAASIAVTALLNLYPVRWVRFDVLALLFGLIHGFGFAGLLLEAAAPSGLLPWALTGFNVGVEAGQLTAVLAWVVISQAVVGKSWYPSVVVRGGSIVLLILAAGWFWQRVS